MTITISPEFVPLVRDGLYFNLLVGPLVRRHGPTLPLHQMGVDLVPLSDHLV
jgi:hypothetical protein